MSDFSQALAGRRAFWAVILGSCGLMGLATLTSQAHAGGFRPTMPIRPAVPVQSLNHGVSAAQINANVMAVMRQQHVPGSPYNLYGPGSPYPHVPYSVYNSLGYPYFSSRVYNPYLYNPYRFYSPYVGLNYYNPYLGYYGANLSAYSSLGYGGLPYGGYWGMTYGGGSGYGIVYPYVSPYVTPAANAVVPANAMPGDQGAGQ